MYESFFHLAVKPFDLLPNPDFLFLSKSHKIALTNLDYAIRERAGFILLTGEIGSGKTTIVRDLIKKNHGETVISKVFNTKVNFEQLISMINEDFGLPAKSREKTLLLRELNEFLIDQYGKGKKPVLIIDEAQNLPPETLEEIRMLSNLETDHAKLLQIILVGQPELRQTLALPELLQLRQRISFYCHIKPLGQEEIEQYILHRLQVAGNREALLISSGAMEIIWRYSRGIPRLINIICDFLLLSAFAEGLKEVTGDLAREIVGDLDFENQYWGGEIAGGAEGARSPSTGTETAACSTRDCEIRGLLTETICRIETLENRESSRNSVGLEDIHRRLIQYDQDFHNYMQTTTKEFEELKKDVQTAKPVVDIEPSQTAGDREKKKGLLRYFFRAV